MSLRKPEVEGVIVGFALFAAFIMIVSTVPIVAFSGGYGDYPVPSNADWIISENTSVWNENILVNGNVTIQSGATLFLTNVTLFINSTSDGQFRLKVEYGGAIRTNLTVIRPYDETHRFKFEAWGDVSLCNTFISHLWGSGNSGGLRLYGNDPWLENLTIIDSGGPGIFTNSTLPHFVGIDITNTTFGIYCEGSFPQTPFDDISIFNATSEAVHLENCNMDISNARVSDCQIGLKVIATMLDIANTSLLNTTNYSIKLQSGSALTATNCVFHRERTDIPAGSSLMVKWDFDLTVIDSDHVPVQNKFVTISEWAGNPVFSGMTDQQGQIISQQLNEFTVIGGMKTYYTPHLIQITGNPTENKFYITAERPIDLTVFCDGDSDNDTINDIQEKSEYIYVFEAEARSYFPGQAVTDQANNNISAAGQDNDAGVLDEGLISLNPAYYKVFIKARQTIANTTENISVAVDDGSTTLASDTFTLANNTRYNWFSLDEFQVTAPSVLNIDISNDNSSSRNILVDSIIILKTKDEMGMPTFTGYISLPLWNDTDQDGLHDGFDINNVANGELSIGTNPMDGDTDNDLLWDGDEVNGYFPEDRVEAEDLFNPIGNVGQKQFSTLWNVKSSNCNFSQFTLNVTIPRSHSYRFKLIGYGDFRLGGVQMSNQEMWHASEEATKSAVEMDLRSVSGTLQQCINSNKEINLYNFTKDPDMGDDYPVFIRWWVQQYDYNLTPGNYRISLRLNLTNITNLYNNTGGSGHGYFRSFEAWTDFIDVEECRADPLDGDRDDDSVLDGLDPVPFNADADEDGLSDAREIQNGTDSLSRDTDKDGIRDRVELKGPNSNNDPYTSWDNASVLNIDGEPSTGTSPTCWDSDGDLLPDGWIDGFNTSHQPGGDWSTSNLTDIYGNMAADKIEGEDIDGDGIQDSGAWPTGETNAASSDSDSDSMPDGFEVFWNNSGVALNPLTNDSSSDADGEGLTNLQEYVVDTHPGNINTDYFLFGENDTLVDNQEALVTLRTNVENGAREFTNYGMLQKNESYEWIWFSNSTATPQEFGYSANYTNYTTSGFGGNANWTIHQYSLEDGTRIEYNRSEQKLYVWQPGSDVNDSDENGVFEGTVWIYSTTSSQSQAETSSSPKVAYKDHEIYLTNPFQPDSDGDTILDGYEGYRGDLFNKWSEDTDRDGLINARDQDSDNDGLYDPTEALFTKHNGTIIYDADNDGVANMLDLDSDGDSILDEDEPSLNDTDGDGYLTFTDWDRDGDGLPDGWVKYQVYGAIWDIETGDFIRQTFTIGDNDETREKNEGEDLDCDTIIDSTETDPNNADTDSDDLTDGKNWHLFSGEPLWGELDAGTDQLDFDTDSDTLFDGLEVKGWNISLINATGPNANVISVHTNSSPLVADTDGDLLEDAIEYLYTNASSWDTDGDSRSDYYEDSNHNGSREATETDPCDPDTDGDYAGDYIEADNEVYPFSSTYSDPLVRDTDDDGLTDGQEDSYNGSYDGAIGTNEPDPRLKDTDADGLTDMQENYIVSRYSLNNTEKDVDNDGLWNIRDPDSDGDHIPDGAELSWYLNFDNDTFSSGHGKPNVLDSNSDGDETTDCWVDAGNFNGVYDAWEGEIYVMWRTNATDTNSDGKNEYGLGEWVLINTGNSTNGNLSYFAYNSTKSTLPPEIQESSDKCTETHEGYFVFYSEFYPGAVIKKDGNTYYYYSFEAAPGGINLSKLPVLPFTIGNQERWSGTSPRNSDTDMDDIIDSHEAQYFTLGDDADFDDDGIKDGMETGENGNQNITCATNNDTDGDGIQDGTELGYTVGIDGITVSIGNYYCEAHGTNTTKFVPDADSFNKTLPNSLDSDSDGLPDGWVDGWAYNRVTKTWAKTGNINGVYDPWEGEENATIVIGNYRWGNGKVDPGETNPLLWDTDGDGIPDGWERWYGLDPNNASDRNADSDKDGLSNYEEYVCGTVPKDFLDHNSGHAWDTDCDGMPDGWESYYDFNVTNSSGANLDADSDGLSNLNEYKVNRSGAWNETVNGTYWRGSDPLNNDTDCDSLLDGIEWNITPGANNDSDSDANPNIFDIDDDNDGLNTFDEIEGWNVTYWLSNFTKIKCHVTSDCHDIDTDNDGLNDFIEYNYSLNPNSQDTDHDGFNDSFELSQNNILSGNSTLFDPVMVEDIVPWSENIPGIHVVEDWGLSGVQRCHVQVSITVHDNIGLDRVTITVTDNKNSNTTYFHGLTNGTATADLDIDYWGDNKDYFTVVAIAWDINNNSNSWINVGGLKKELVSYFANVLFAQKPGDLGVIWGFIYGFGKAVWDNSPPGMIWNQYEMLSSVKTLADAFGLFDRNQAAWSECVAIYNAAVSSNPYNPNFQRYSYDCYNTGFNLGYATGACTYYILTALLLVKCIESGPKSASVAKAKVQTANIPKSTVDATLNKGDIVVQDTIRGNKKINAQVKSGEIDQNFADFFNEAQNDKAIENLRSYNPTSSKFDVTKQWLLKKFVPEEITTEMKIGASKLTDKTMNTLDTLCLNKGQYKSMLELMSKSIEEWSPGAIKGLFNTFKEYGYDTTKFNRLMKQEGFQTFMDSQKTEVAKGTTWTVEIANRALDKNGNGKIIFEVSKGGMNVDVWDDVNKRWIEAKTRNPTKPIDHPREIDSTEGPLLKAHQQIAAARKINPGRSEVHLKINGKVNVSPEAIKKELTDKWQNSNIDEIYIYDEYGNLITSVIF